MEVFRKFVIVVDRLGSGGYIIGTFDKISTAERYGYDVLGPWKSYEVYPVVQKERKRRRD